MHASFPALRRAALVLAGVFALAFAGCSGASTPPPEAASAPAETSTAEVEVAVVPEATAEPEATSTEAAEAGPPKTVFYVNRPFKGDPQLVLTRVTKKPDGLKLDFMFNNKGNLALIIKVSPAGDSNAMFVDLLDGRRLEYKSSEGIAIKPETDRLEPGDKEHFSVTFDPLPEGVTKFDVYEGEGAKNGPPGQGQYWVFRNVQLK